MSSPYRQPMAPWSGLAQYTRRVILPDSLGLHIYDSGTSDKPPALLVHGLGDDADTWRHIFDPLTGHFRVIALDLPGFARSDPAPGAYRMPFFKDFLLQLMDTLSIQRVTFVGHSMGAFISQYIALECPDRVAKLILLDGTVISRVQKINRQLLLFLTPVIGEWLYNRLRKDPQAAYATLQPYYANLDALPEADRRFLFERVNQRVWSDTQRVAYFSSLRDLARWAPRQRRKMESQLAESLTPTLLVWGGQDQINPLENAHICLEIQPVAHLVVIPQAGHNLQQERPGELIDAILEFLSKEGSDGPNP